MATRYERYLLYRQRALRRLKRVRGRVAQYNPASNGQSRKALVREFDWHLETKQMPRTYPRHPIFNPSGTDSPLYWRVLPWYRQWGVREYTYTVPFGYSPNHHPTFGILGYAHRRVISLPPLKHLPKKPIRPFVMIDPKWQFYPFEFYPSGQRNSHWPPPE